MSYEQVRDILDRVRAVHRRLRDELERVRPGATDDRTRFVLEALRCDEQAMNLALAQYQRQRQGKSPLETWIQYIPDEEMQRLLDETHFTRDMDPEDVLAQKVQIDQSLAELYRSLAEQVSAPRVREVFERLAEQTSQRLAQECWRIIDSDSAPAHERRRR